MSERRRRSNSDGGWAMRTTEGWWRGMSEKRAMAVGRVNAHLKMGAERRRASACVSKVMKCRRGVCMCAKQMQ